MATALLDLEIGFQEQVSNRALKQIYFRGKDLGLRFQFANAKRERFLVSAADNLATLTASGA
jgi:hypothetical protein